MTHKNNKFKTTKNERHRGRMRRVRLTPAVLFLLCVFVVVTVLLSYYGILPFQIFPSQDESSSIDVELVKSQDLSIHFLELGNKYTGDCTLIKVGDTEVLIDAGSKVSSIPTIKNYLDQYIEDQTIEYVIVTHAHEDHYAGFATNEDEDSLFDLYEFKTVIQFAQTSEGKTEKPMYKNYIREVNELIDNGANVYTAKDCILEENGAKPIYELSDTVQLEILDQRFYYEAEKKEENNHSVCCQIIQNNDKYYLFTGDLEKEGEESLVEKNNLQQVELYKAGHHGSKTSSHNVLLDVIKPKVVCVCCCAGSSEYTDINENQFPTQEFIDRVALYTSNVFVTTLCLDYSNNKFKSMNGNIVVCCNQYDYAVTISCSNNKTILKNTKWFKNNRNKPTAWL